LSKGRSDIVVIKRGKGLESVFAIHNMTENKINYQLNDNDLPGIIDNDFNMRDFLTSNKYNWKNISLDPFQVIWLGPL
jgi:sucrose phosphorylase